MARTALTLLFILEAWLSFAQRATTFTALSYNIENAFDTIHDEGKNDWEYCTGGERRWTTSRLFKKLHSISKVIAAADEERPVDIIGLCEVENENVMNCLTKASPLRHMGYKYVMTESEDERGIDVALLYSPFTFRLFAHESIRVNTQKRKTRDILHASGSLTNGDTLDIYVVHLPSKRGGASALRFSLHATEILASHIDSVASSRTKPNIILLGDFNADTNSPQIKRLTKEGLLTAHTLHLKPGSYKYQGEWSTIDHILSYLSSLSHKETKALPLPFLIQPDETNRGIKPLRTFLGTAYAGGVSDHLPVMSVFEWK